MALLRWFFEDPFGERHWHALNRSQYQQQLEDLFDPYLRMEMMDNRGAQGDVSPVQPYWRNNLLQTAQSIGDSVGEIQNDAEKFAVKVNCSHFRPDELTVNVNGRELIVAGHHEEKSDPYGRVERHFVRKFALPKDANAEGLVCHLSKEGHLTVTAPKLALDATATRNIPIQTGNQAMVCGKKMASGAEESVAGKA